MYRANVIIERRLGPMSISILLLYLCAMLKFISLQTFGLFLAAKILDANLIRNSLF